MSTAVRRPAKTPILIPGMLLGYTTGTDTFLLLGVAILHVSVERVCVCVCVCVCEYVSMSVREREINDKKLGWTIDF